jgi:EAL domain-containing protein (putative c-di-GMP-specific phosphodiesterase class I)
VNESQDVHLLPALRYAQRDAESVHKTLTDPARGLWAAADLDLLVGGNANAAETKRALRRRVRETQAEDLLLVYFSGHAFVPTWSRTSEVYLGTQNLPIDALEDEPDAGLRMSFLRQDVFEVIRGASILLLDCCLANDYLASRGTSPGPATVPGSHAALLSYSPDAKAREKDALQHGEFTAALLEALQAEDSATGQVTMESLHTFMRRRLPSKPLYEVRNGGVYDPLTKHRHGPARGTSQLAQNPPALAKYWESRPPLAASAGGIRTYLDKLLGSLPHPGSDSTAGLPYYLEAVRRATAGQQALILTLQDSNLHVEVSTGPQVVLDLHSALAGLATRAINLKSAALSHLGTVSGRTEFLYGVPIEFGKKNHVRMLVIMGNEPPIEALEEPLAVLCRSTLQFAGQAGDPRMMELLLLTELKKSFGRLPADLYERAFHLYQREIGRLVMIFEPMVRLEEDGPADEVYGYEALARTDHEATQAPAGLLGLPNSWGPRFVIERDGVLACKALAEFGSLHRRANTGHASPPLSVNVAIRSLVSPAYESRLREGIRSARLRGGVTLEISEQDALELPPDTRPLPDVMAAFRRRLVQLIEDMDVNFAIDDFGVGHSSLDRLASLDLAQVKVDQAILKHPLVLKELRLIADMAAVSISRSGRRRLVVLEGINEGVFQRRRTGEHIRLKDFYDAGVNLIQGHIMPHRTLDLRPFDDSITAKMKRYWT